MRKAKPTGELSEWLRFAVSDLQVEILTAYHKGGSYEEASSLTGHPIERVRNTINHLHRKAADEGYVPGVIERPTMPGFGTKFFTERVSVNEKGEHQLQHYYRRQEKSHTNLEREALAFIEACKEDIPREKLSKYKPKGTNPDLVNLYVITDYHFGMMAWGEETRQGNWDLQIAEQRLIDWFKMSIERSPQAGTAVICFLGDSLHFDGMIPETPASKHPLDADSRFQKIVRMWIRARRRIHQLILQKYPKVHLIDAEGNHDPVTGIHNREWWDVHYEDEPRFTVDTSPDPFYCFEWGDVSLFFHHGHKKRFPKVDDTFVAKFRKVFGRTKYSFGHMGHLHHRAKETNLMVVEQHRTLSESDAYASRNGFISGREAQVITYHKKDSEIGRVITTPQMLEE